MIEEHEDIERSKLQNKDDSRVHKKVLNCGGAASGEAYCALMQLRAYPPLDWRIGGGISGGSAGP